MGHLLIEFYSISTSDIFCFFFVFVI